MGPRVRRLKSIKQAWERMLRIICAMLLLCLAAGADKSAAGYGPRPAAWCGWEMRHLVGSDPGPAYNRARQWASWGRAAYAPAPGVIGVMPHHVFKVVAVLGHGIVLAISGNDGHALRTRARSTAGVIAWRQGY